MGVVLPLLGTGSGAAVMMPLVVVAGFLGAGKTTFLRQLLAGLPSAGLRGLVILNDYQRAPIDAASLRPLAEQVWPISGSCVCCGSREELLELLADLPPEPGSVALVEVNGTTATETLLEVLGGAPALGHLTPPLQVTVVDARRFGARAWHNPLERAQVVTATHLVLTRHGEVSPERLDTVKAEVRAVAPAVPWTDSSRFSRELGALEIALRRLPDRQSLAASPAATGRVPGPASSRSTSHEAHHFASLQCHLPDTVPKRAFEAFLAGLPGEVMRAKGIVRFAEAPEELRVFQVVEGEASVAPGPLIVREEEEYVPIAVFVGPRIPALMIRARIAKLAAP